MDGNLADLSTTVNMMDYGAQAQKGAALIKANTNDHRSYNKLALALELENKLFLKEKELDKISSKSKKVNGKIDLYLDLLDNISQNDQTYQSLISKIKRGL